MVGKKITKKKRIECNEKNQTKENTKDHWKRRGSW